MFYDGEMACALCGRRPAYSCVARAKRVQRNGGHEPEADFRAVGLIFRTLLGLLTDTPRLLRDLENYTARSELYCGDYQYNAVPGNQVS
jgi:hypothetical protein